MDKSIAGDLPHLHHETLILMGTVTVGILLLVGRGNRGVLLIDHLV